MEKSRIRSSELVVVRDGRKVMVLENLGDTKARRAVSDELGKDWVKMPIRQIETNLHQAKLPLH